MQALNLIHVQIVKSQHWPIGQFSLEPIEVLSIMNLL